MCQIDAFSRRNDLFFSSKMKRLEAKKLRDIMTLLMLEKFYISQCLKKTKKEKQNNYFCS